MTERYTELYIDDAMRLCQYIAKEDGVISVVVGDPEGFPEPPKGESFPENGANIVRVTRGEEVVAECAYLYRRDGEHVNWKFRNKWLIRLMFGDELKAAMNKSGMSIRELAAATGYRSHSLEAMLRGRYDLSLEQIGRLSDALDCELRLVPKNK